MKKEVKLIKKIKLLLRRAKCPEFLHRFGPKTYKLYQHAFALFIKEECKLSFRRVSKLLRSLGFKVPTYSALCKMRLRIPFWILKELFAKTTNFKLVHILAIDSTGLSRTNPSWHYIKRIDRKKPIKRHVQLSASFDTRRKKFISLRVRAKPRGDVKDAPYLVKRTRSKVCKLVADRGYDSEEFFEFLNYRQIEPVIKTKRTSKKGFFRKKMKKAFRERTYHRRSLIESGFGSLKRKYGSYVSGRNIGSQRAEVYIRAILHNISSALRDFQLSPVKRKLFILEITTISWRFEVLLVL